jgi:PAS domain S-box-containing protein
MDNAQIMVVEDENIVAMDIENSLIGLGYGVPAVASAGDEAIEQAGETHPNLVLMDITLKGEIDGVEAAEQIRQRYDIPVVYLTAHADERTLQRAKITEPFGYVLKPFEDRQLHITIEMALYKHRMERRIKESEQWLSAVLRSIDDAVMATDTTGVITFMNPLAEALTGWRHGDAMGKEFTEVCQLLNGGGRDHPENPVAQAIEYGGLIGKAGDSTLLGKDGTETSIDYSAAPIRDKRGSVMGAVVVFRDITERKHAEEVLRQSALRYRHLVETASDIIFTLSTDGVVTSLNPAFEMITGWARGEWMGKRFESLIHPDDLPLAIDFFHHVTEGQTPPSCELRVQSKSGDYAVLDFVAIPQIVDGRVTGAWGIGRDLTVGKRTEESRR